MELKFISYWLIVEFKIAGFVTMIIEGSDVARQLLLSLKQLQWCMYGLLTLKYRVVDVQFF